VLGEQESGRRTAVAPVGGILDHEFTAHLVCSGEEDAGSIGDAIGPLELFRMSVRGRHQSARGVTHANGRRPSVTSFTSFSTEVSADGESGAGWSGENTEIVPTSDSPQERVKELVLEYVMRFVAVSSVAVD
jgi:hypothetical protein